MTLCFLCCWESRDFRNVKPRCMRKLLRIVHLQVSGAWFFLLVGLSFLKINAWNFAQTHTFVRTWRTPPCQDFVFFLWLKSQVEEFIDIPVPQHVEEIVKAAFCTCNSNALPSKGLLTEWDLADGCWNVNDIESQKLPALKISMRKCRGQMLSRMTFPMLFRVQSHFGTPGTGV